MTVQQPPPKHPILKPTPPVPDPYGSVAGFYGTFLDPFIISWKKKALGLFPPQKAMTVLDAGFGTGAQLNLYHRYGCRIFGIEISNGMIAAARKKYKDRLNLCRGNAGRMPYRDQSFDLILLSMMLHETSARMRSAVLQESRRVLKDSGRILIIDYRLGPHGVSGQIFKAIINIIERAAGKPHFQNYRDFIKNGGLPPLLRQHGWTVEKHGITACGNIGLTLARRGQP